MTAHHMAWYLVAFLALGPPVAFGAGPNPLQGGPPTMATKRAVTPVIEAENVVYDYEDAQNGSSPLWCYGNTCIVRVGNDVFASGIETLKNVKPMVNVRWTFFKLQKDAWALLQADRKGRTREPCPLACFQNGRIFLSNNPLTSGHSARPEILEFDAANPKAPFKTLTPTWDRRPAFSQHSYRTFAADAERRELILFQNIGTSHSEWAFRDKNGNWSARGRLVWKRREDASISPYGAKQARANYPNVVLKNRAVYFVGAAAYNKWAHVKTMDLAGRRYGNRWRRLFYTWTPDITTRGFSKWLELASTHETGGWLFPGDLWVDDQGVAHIAWFEAPVNEELREKHFPDLKIVYSLQYAQIKRGKVVLKKTLVEGGEGKSLEIPGHPGLGNYLKIPSKNEASGFLISDQAGRGQPRFHIMPDGRLFALYYVGGKSRKGKPVSENRLMEIHKDGSTGKAIRVPLKHPLIEFFTATPRGGSAPSDVIDILGYRKSTLMKKVCYARIRLKTP